MIEEQKDECHITFLIPPEPEKKYCRICSDPLNEGIVVNNSKYTGRERKRFPYMGKDESMHIECYIHQCTLNSFNKIMEDKNLILNIKV